MDASTAPADDDLTAPPAGAPGGARTPGRIARSILSVLFGIIGVIGVLASVIAVWSHQTLFDPSSMSEAVDNALLNPEVSDALAVYLTDQVMAGVPLDDLVTERVPEELEALVPVFVGGVRTVVQEVFTRVLENDDARAAFVATVERAHQAVMRLLEGDGLADGITVEGGEVSVNLLPLLSRGLEALQERGLLTDVDLPELTADGDPSEQQAALEDAIGRQLPDDFGQLAVYESDTIEKSAASLAQAQDAMALFRRSVVAVVALTVAALAVSFALAVQRRRAGIALLLAIVAALVVARVAIRTVVEKAPGVAVKPGGRAAIEEVVTTLAEGLQRLIGVGLLVAVTLALIAFLLGSERAKARVRTVAASTSGLRGVLDQRRDETVLASVAMALLVVTLAGFSALSLVVTVALLGLAAWAAWAPRAVAPSEEVPAL